MIIYCCQCEKDVTATLTDGSEIYPHRPDLYLLPFWKCSCGNFVGCHHKTKNRTAPLGCIPNKAIKAKRMQIHAVLDPLWKDGLMSRKDLYAKLTDTLGRQYHTADLRSIAECEIILKAIKGIKS